MLLVLMHCIGPGEKIYWLRYSSKRELILCTRLSHINCILMMTGNVFAAQNICKI